MYLGLRSFRYTLNELTLINSLITFKFSWALSNIHELTIGCLHRFLPNMKTVFLWSVSANLNTKIFLSQFTIIYNTNWNINTLQISRNVWAWLVVTETGNRGRKAILRRGTFKKNEHLILVLVEPQMSFVLSFLKVKMFKCFWWLIY